MLLPVIPEMVLPPEGLFANVTRVRPLVRVSALVYKQVVRLGEVSVAEPADELFLGPRDGSVVVVLMEVQVSWGGDGFVGGNSFDRSIVIDECRGTDRGGGGGGQRGGQPVGSGRQAGQLFGECRKTASPAGGYDDGGRSGGFRCTSGAVQSRRFVVVMVVVIVVVVVVVDVIVFVAQRGWIFAFDATTVVVFVILQHFMQDHHAASGVRPVDSDCGHRWLTGHGGQPLQRDVRLEGL